MQDFWRGWIKGTTYACAMGAGVTAALCTLTDNLTYLGMTFICICVMAWGLHLMKGA